MPSYKTTSSAVSREALTSLILSLNITFAAVKSSVIVDPLNDQAFLKCLSDGTVASAALILFPSLSTILVVI
jgi:hypothetical protein